MLYDVAILGSGSMGAAAALALARRGLAVLALDQSSVPNARSEHSGEARMFRSAYYEHPAYVPLLQRSRELWLDLNRHANRTLYHQTGALYLGPQGCDLVERSAHAAALHGLPHERLTPAALARRFPQFAPPPGSSALVEPHAGLLTPEPAVAAMAALARDLGATIGTHEPALELHPQADDEFTILTDRSRYTAKAVILSAGAWTTRLLAASNLPLPPITISRQPLAWCAPAPADLPAFDLGAHPCWAYQDEPNSLLYGFPRLPGAPDFRIARHRVGAAVGDPDALDRAPTPADLDDLAFIPRLLPAAGPISRAAVAFYSNSPDGHPILDRLPGWDRLFLASGFSGHGFKFAPIVGEILADLVQHNATPHDIALFAWRLAIR